MLRKIHIMKLDDFLATRGLPPFKSLPLNMQLDILEKLHVIPIDDVPMRVRLIHGEVCVV